MTSVVRDNLMNQRGYSPYCGNDKCPVVPRASFNGKQFVCKSCGWVSQFDPKFISQYKRKWRLS